MKVNIFNIYVLKLIKNRYYIGKTSKDISIRYSQHKKGFGAKWTELYKPINIIEFFKSNNKFDEDNYTKKYMELYGIENVRGGSYSNIKLVDYQLRTLEQELRTANDLCFKCGKSGHFASQCKFYYE